MEMDRPPACYLPSVQDGKQEIYLEWPKNYASIIGLDLTVEPTTTHGKNMESINNFLSLLVAMMSL